MKFQIIIESTDKKKALMPDDEFEKLVGKSLKIPGFRLVGARNLDGIRPECWEPANRKFPAAQPSVKDLQKRIDELEAKLQPTDGKPKKKQHQSVRRPGHARDALD